MAARRKVRTVEELSEALAALRGEPSGAEATALLREALGHRHWMPVERAAEIVGRQGLTELAPELASVWGRFQDPGPKLDPGCRAKLAALTALDALEGFDPEPFLAAIRHVQLEPVWGGRVDTAGGVRVRSLFALLRQHHPAALLHAGELLADPLPDVRAQVAEGIGHYGVEGGACLLVHRLLAGDEAQVLLACATAALEVAADFTAPLLDAWLRADSGSRREVAALALGQHRAEGGAARLIAWLEGSLAEPDLELGIRALALHRSETARRFLLDCIADSSPLRARAAVQALAQHRYDSQLWARVREAARRSPHPKIAQLVAAAAKEP